MLARPSQSAELYRRMDELAREYGKTPPGDPRRADIANEISELCLILDRLRAKVH